MLFANGPDAELRILAWVRNWCDLLAAGQLAEACAWIDEANDHGVVWTPESISACLVASFAPGTRLAAQHPEGLRFTSPTTAAGRERHDFGPFGNRAGFWFEYDVPLNGAFSALTAQFEFHWRAAQTLAAQLHDLHVM